MSTNFEPPNWAGKAPPGYHLDVMKEGKMFQKLMVDEKPYYLFGRNIELTDFSIDHASCSRVHAALIYHKILERFFLMDLGSTHGSFIGTKQLEPQTPTQLPIDSTFHFGASTRFYTLREKPKAAKEAEGDSANVELPESELEIDNLTEYNTAQNRQISMLGIASDEAKAMTVKRCRVTFNEEEQIINPEDVDPNVGRFRDSVQTYIIPNKKPRLSSLDNDAHSLSSIIFNRSRPLPSSSSGSKMERHNVLANPNNLITSHLGIRLPNPAPEIEDNKEADDEKKEETQTMSLYDIEDLGPDGSQLNAEADHGHKKYAKETWPGQHGLSL